MKTKAKGQKVKTGQKKKYEPIKTEPFKEMEPEYQRMYQEWYEQWDAQHVGYSDVDLHY